MDNIFLQLENIEKKYDDGYIACQNINLSIEKGKFVTILGPSGCGKTTILKMLAGFENPTSGRIRFNGIDIKDLPIHMRPTATVFQDYALFPSMTIYENICYGLKVMRVKLESIDSSKYKQLARIKNKAINKANNKIVSLKQQKIDLYKNIQKIKSIYEKNPDWIQFQNMRYQQFILMVDHYKKIISKTNPSFSENFKLSWKIKRKILKNKINTKNFSKSQQQLFKFLYIYFSKEKFDKKIDKLLEKLNVIDSNISYWHTYPLVIENNFQKLHLTRKLNKDEIKKRANNVIELVGLQGSENKYPSDLSGGMQQRVALARSIVVEPEILLLDEPLSALDAKVRKKMQEELKRIHNELKINFIFVTHDQEEALRLSDQVVVMSAGKIEQVGTAKNIYEHPANTWVANFIGQANFVDCQFINENKISIFGKELEFLIKKDLINKLKQNPNFKILIRPEDIDVCEIGTGFMDVYVYQSLYKGAYYEIKALDKNKKTITFLTYDPQKINSKISIKWNFKYVTPMVEKRLKSIGA